LRAYCAKKIIADQLKAKGIKDVDFYLSAKEYRSRGPEYRGVTHNYSIDNLYVHKNKELRRLRQEMITHEQELGKLDQGVEKTANELDDLIFFLERLDDEVTQKTEKIKARLGME